MRTARTCSATTAVDSPTSRRPRIWAADRLAVAAVAGDYDNDGRVDLLLLKSDGGALMHQAADGSFTDVTTAVGLSSQALRSRTAAWVDVDHDGDLDLIAGLPLRLWRNNGNGTFTDITTAAGLAASIQGVAIVPTDFDNRRDVDLLLAGEGAQPLLYRNMRDGTFKDAAAQTRPAARSGLHRGGGGRHQQGRLHRLFLRQGRRPRRVCDERRTGTFCGA